MVQTLTPNQLHRRDITAWQVSSEVVTTATIPISVNPTDYGAFVKRKGGSERPESVGEICLLSTVKYRHQTAPRLSGTICLNGSQWSSFMASLCVKRLLSSTRPTDAMSMYVSSQTPQRQTLVRSSSSAAFLFKVSL